MSCYFRHLREVFSAAGIEVTRANRDRIDRAIHDFVHTAPKDCPLVWRKLKTEVLADAKKQQELVAHLRDAMR